MPTVITRLYPTESAAMRVVSALQEIDLGDRATDVVTAPADELAPADPADIQRRLRATGVYAKAAEIYAQKIAGGSALLVARAPFGRAVDALAVVDRFDSLDAGVAYREVYDRQLSAPANVLRMSNRRRILAKNKTITGVSLSGGKNKPVLAAFPLIARRRAGKKSVGSSKPVTARFGFPMLSRPPAKTSTSKTSTPFSSALGLPTIIRRRGVN